MDELKKLGSLSERLFRPRRCGVCDLPRPRLSSHRCRASAGYVKWRRTYCGAVRQSRKVVWRCRHDHRRRGEALACSRKALKQMQRHGNQSPARTLVPPNARDGRRIPDLTSGAWERMKADTGHRCYYCGTSTSALEQEHRIPLSRGGASLAANIVPACRRCNREKRSLTDTEFLDRKYPRGIPSRVPAGARRALRDDPPFLPANVSPEWLIKREWRTWGPPSQMIRGAQHYRGAIRRVARITSDLSYAKPGAITLRREPTNRHDPNAIRAEIDGELVGYVAKGDAQMLAAQLDAAGCAFAVVAGVIRGGGERHHPLPRVMAWPDRRISQGPLIESLMSRDGDWQGGGR